MSTSLSDFLHGRIDGRTFRHADHIRIAFDVLSHHAFLESAQICSGALKDIAARAGNAGAYHETITVAFLALIGERRVPGETFETFRSRNPDLFAKDVLARWYGDDQLSSPLARRTFVLPSPRT
jgi:hypothetical protein